MRIRECNGGEIVGAKIGKIVASGEWRMNWTIYVLTQSHKKKAHIDISTWAF
jgi:hypothetical protein